MLIDRYLPPSDTVVFHGVVVTAPPDRAWARLRHFDFFRVPALRIPNLMRLWPERLWRWVRRQEPLPPAPRSVTLDDLLGPLKSFQALDEEPGQELVLGSVGRFWTRDFGPVPFTPRTFTSLSPPDCGKIAWTLRVEPFGERRSLLLVDVRVATTDAQARRHFQRYWRVAGPVVRFLARRTLARVKALLERAPEAGEVRGPALLLDQQLPSFTVSDVFLRKVDAPAAAAYVPQDRLLQLMLESPLIRALGAVRSGLDALLRRLGRRARPAAPPEAPPMVRLAEHPGEEYVLGLIGRFWEAGYGFLPFEPGEFAAFRRPGYAKVALDLAVRPLGPGRSLAILEDRVEATDEEAWRAFRGYWRWLKLGVRPLMWTLLRLVQKDAERSAHRPTRLQLEPAGELLPSPAH